MNKIWLKTLVFFVVAFLLYGVHFYLLSHVFDQGEDQLYFLNFSYLFNLSAALIICLTVFLVSLNNKKHLAFLFMGLGMLKLVLFFVIAKKIGISLNKSLFLIFVFPYLISMIIEFKFLKRTLSMHN